MKPVFFCVDIGGTKTAWAVYDGAGNELAYGRFPTEPARGAEDLADRVRKDAAPALVGYDLIGACIASPGPLDASRGLILHIVTMGWTNVEIAKLFSERFGVPFLLLNDCDSGALGVASRPELCGCRSVCYMSVSTGIGGGIVIDGKLYNGRGNGGDFGHMPVPGEGLKCGCGKTDCLELYASGSGIENRYRTATGKALPCAGIEALAREGDPVACRVYEDAAKALVFAANALHAVMDPEKLVLGGSVCRSGDLLLAPLKRSYPDVVFADDDGKQVLRGAFVYARQHAE